MIDYMILYEHKARELENSVYLSCFLKKRGYKTAILPMASFKKKLYRPKVIVVPHIYDDNQVDFYTGSVWKSRHAKLINMQYEQNLAQNTYIKTIHIPKGKAIEAYHVAWGQQEFDNYIKAGIDEKRILRLGCLGVDFDSLGYKNYLFSKSELSKKTGISNDKKWLVFFSSFSLTGKTEDEVPNDFLNFYHFQLECQKGIIEWFEKLLSEDKFSDCCLIYRNHPAEMVADTVKRLHDKYPERFIINDQYTIRHWISASDVCLTVTSTTHVDAFYSSKSCYILRPIPMLPEFEMDTLVGEQGIKNYDEFCGALAGDYVLSSLNEKRIHQIYDNEIDKPVIKKYIDGFEKVLIDDGAYRFVSCKPNIKTRLAQDLLGILCDLSKYIKLSNLFRKIPKLYIPLKLYEREVYGLNKEIKFYKTKIEEFLIDDMFS